MVETCSFCLLIVAEITGLSKLFSQTTDLLAKGIEVLSEVLVYLHPHLQYLCPFCKHEGGKSVSNVFFPTVDVSQKFRDGVASE